MANKQEVIKAFREARIAGKKLLSQGKITWDQYATTMIGFELTLKAMGENL